VKALLRVLIAVAALLSFVAIVELTVGWGSVFTQTNEAQDIEKSEPEPEPEPTRISSQGRYPPEPKSTGSTSSSRKTSSINDLLRGFSGFVREPNSAGGVDVDFIFTYQRTNPVKYLTFEVTPYNAVGDIAPSSIGQKSKTNIRYTGPLSKSDKTIFVTASNVWYNSTITEIHLTALTIEYMDPTIPVETIEVDRRYKREDSLF